MKKGFWNYTEPVLYRVVLVELLPVKAPPMHWQNAMAGTQRQAVEIHYGKGATAYIFYIDNGDGSGLLKMEKRGGPDSFHRSINEESAKVLQLVPQYEWTQYDPRLVSIDEETIATWQKKHYPEQYAKAQALKEAWRKSQMNPRNGHTAK